MKIINLIFVIIVGFIKISYQQRGRKGRKNEINNKIQQPKKEENIIPDINDNIQKDKNNILQTKKEKNQKTNKIEFENDINEIEKKNDNLNNTKLKNESLNNNTKLKNESLNLNFTKKKNDLRNESVNIIDEKVIEKKELKNIKINQENQSLTHKSTKNKDNKNMTNLEKNLTDNKLMNTKLNEELKENNTINFSKTEFKINEKEIEKTFTNKYNNLTTLNNTKFNESIKKLTEKKEINLTEKISKNDLINDKSKIYNEKKIEQNVSTNFNIDNKIHNLTQKTLNNNTEKLNHTFNKLQINNKTHLENKTKEDIKKNKIINNYDQKKEETININDNINYPQSFIGKYTYFIQKDINKFVSSPLDNLVIMFFGYIFMTLIITFINSFQKDNDNKSHINEEKILNAIRQIKIKGNNNNNYKNDLNTIQNFDINEKNLKEFIHLKEQLNELLDTTIKRNNKLSNENITRENICDLQTRIMSKINN